MKINVQLDNGYLPDEYSKYCNETDKRAGQPIKSFPIVIQKIPTEAKFLGWSLIDYEAVPRTGFPFIHWLASDVPITNNIAADFSRQSRAPQGKNAWYSRFYAVDDSYVENHYAGPVPPDKPHHYTLTVYALKAKTNLKPGFFYNDFRTAITQQQIEHAEFVIPARN
ncbi:YbhB/YbcL family Raf kinase inhibitor-like protein [Pediococcus siamensis]|uniref:YbhB/YbcL family Raf kinase inhibitor-like protein n=1 Tax=Pediococcus siamensis TaxID=381829 RepID=UPI0039A0FDDE